MLAFVLVLFHFAQLLFSIYVFQPARNVVVQVLLMTQDFLSTLCIVRSFFCQFVKLLCDFETSLAPPIVQLLSVVTCLAYFSIQFSNVVFVHSYTVSAVSTHPP